MPQTKHIMTDIYRKPYYNWENEMYAQKQVLVVKSFPSLSLKLNNQLVPQFTVLRCHIDAEAH